MALEVLENVKDIGGEPLLDVTDSDEGLEGAFICYDRNVNSIGFRIQKGPIKEVGVNGCQVDVLIEAARVIIDGLNKQFPCPENSIAITKLEEALMWLENRRINRMRRDVEGTSEK